LIYTIRPRFEAASADLTKVWPPFGLGLGCKSRLIKEARKRNTPKSVKAPTISRAGLSRTAGTKSSGAVPPPRLPLSSEAADYIRPAEGASSPNWSGGRTSAARPTHTHMERFSRTLRCSA